MVVSDFTHNTGTLPETAAAKLNVPIFTVGIGPIDGDRPDEMGKVVLVGVEPVSDGLVDLVVGRPRPSTG